MDETDDLSATLAETSANHREAAAVMLPLAATIDRVVNDVLAALLTEDGRCQYILAYDILTLLRFDDRKKTLKDLLRRVRTDDDVASIVGAVSAATKLRNKLAHSVPYANVKVQRSTGRVLAIQTFSRGRQELERIPWSQYESVRDEASAALRELYGVLKQLNGV